MVFTHPKAHLLRLLTAAAIAVVVCPFWVAFANDQPYAGTEIVVADITRGTSNAVRPFIREFEEATGITVRFEQYPAGDLFQRVLLDVEARTGNYDVMYLSPSWMGALVEGDHLVALDDLIAEHGIGLDDFMPIGLDLVRYHDREGLWAMPYLLTVHVLVYRADLFEDQDEQAAFLSRFGYELKPPETMAQLLDVAEFFTRDLDGNGQNDLFGFAEPQKAHFQAWDWAQHLIWSFGGEVLDPDLNVILNSDESVRAFEFGLRLQQFQPSAVLGWESEHRALFEDGRLVMMRAWNEVADAMNNPGASAVAGNVGFTTLPRFEGNELGLVAGQSRIGGGGLAILSGSRNQGAAFEYLKWISSPEMGRRLYREGGSIVRISVFDDPDLRALRPWLEDLFPVTQAALLHTAKHRVTLPESFAIEEEIGQAWVSFVRGNASAEEALQTAHRNIERIMRDAGYYD